MISVTKAELLKMPVGTIFRGWVPLMFRGEWMRLEDVWPNDFIYSIIGPSFEMNHDKSFISIDSENTSRDGCYDENERYIVLEQVDIAAMVAQLLGSTPSPVVSDIPLEICSK